MEEYKSFTHAIADMLEAKRQTIKAVPRNEKTKRTELKTSARPDDDRVGEIPTKQDEIQTKVIDEAESELLKPEDLAKPKKLELKDVGTVKKKTEVEINPETEKMGFGEDTSSRNDPTPISVQYQTSSGKWVTARKTSTKPSDIILAMKSVQKAYDRNRVRAIDPFGGLVDMLATEPPRQSFMEAEIERIEAMGINEGKKPGWFIKGLALFAKADSPVGKYALYKIAKAEAEEAQEREDKRNRELVDALKKKRIDEQLDELNLKSSPSSNVQDISNHPPIYGKPAPGAKVTSSGLAKDTSGGWVDTKQPQKMWDPVKKQYTKSFEIEPEKAPPSTPSSSELAKTLRASVSKFIKEQKSYDVPKRLQAGKHDALEWRGGGLGQPLVKLAQKAYEKYRKKKVNEAGATGSWSATEPYTGTIIPAKIDKYGKRSLAVPNWIGGPIKYTGDVVQGKTDPSSYENVPKNLGVAAVAGTSAFPPMRSQMGFFAPEPASVFHITGFSDKPMSSGKAQASERVPKAVPLVQQKNGKTILSAETKPEGEVVNELSKETIKAFWKDKNLTIKQFNQMVKKDRKQEAEQELDKKEQKADE